MFSFFKKDPKKALQKEYEKLMKEAYELAKTDRAASDKKIMEAEKIGQQLEQM